MGDVPVVRLPVLTVRARTVALSLLAVFGVLLAIHVAGVVAIHAFGHARDGWVAFFDIDFEFNPPTLFACQMWFLSAALLGLTAALERGQGNRQWTMWAFWSVLFVCLACDDMLVLHERIEKPVREAVHAHGLLYEAWTIPYAAGLVVLGLCSISYLRSLPRRTLGLMVAAGVIFVGCKIGLEMFVGRHTEQLWMAAHPGATRAMAEAAEGDQYDLYFDVVSTLKHSGKFLGLILYIYALIDHLEIRHRELRLRFGGHAAHT